MRRRVILIVIGVVGALFLVALVIGVLFFVFSSSSTPTYSGGGTFFYDLQRSFSPPKGGMVSFRGDQCLHGGNPVLEGTRYIIAIFLYLDEDLAAPVLLAEDCDSQQQKKTFEFSFF